MLVLLGFLQGACTRVLTCMSTRIRDVILKDLLKQPQALADSFSVNATAVASGEGGADRCAFSYHRVRLLGSAFFRAALYYLSEVWKGVGSSYLLAGSVILPCLFC